MATKKKDIHDMTIVELLNHFDKTIGPEGDLLDGHDETLELIMETWPFCEIAELRETVNNLSDTVRKLKDHIHAADGSVYVKA